METYYIKKGKRYIPVGYNAPDMHDGLYLTEKTSYGRRTTSVAYWLGQPKKQPVDLLKLIEVMKNDDRLANYLSKIQDEESVEFKELKIDSGGYVKEPPRIYNISMQDLALAVLRFMYNELAK